MREILHSCCLKRAIRNQKAHHFRRRVNHMLDNCFVPQVVLYLDKLRSSELDSFFHNLAVILFVSNELFLISFINLVLFGLT